MNYHILKNLIDSLIENFKCPNCESEITDKNLDIVGAAGNTVNLDLCCPNCEKHTFIKSELSQVDLGNQFNLKMENVDELKKIFKEQILNHKGEKPSNKESDKLLINDKEILELRNRLKTKNLRADDFLETK